MDNDILTTAGKIQPAREAAAAAVDHYRQTIEDPDSTRGEIKEACNNALRALAILTDLQTEYTNELITAGQIMSDHIAGKKPGPKS